MPVLPLVGLVLAAAASPPGPTTPAAPPHGGVVAAAGDGELEFVVGPDRLALFPLDAQLHPGAVGDAEALLLPAEGAPLPMTAAGDHWEAANPFGTGKTVTLVAVVRRAAGSTATRFEVQSSQGSMYHDHRPFHGGQVGMAGERHLELATAPTPTGQELQLYLTDAFRQPAPLDGVHGALTIQEGGRSVTLPLVPAGDCLTVETGKPSGPRSVHVHLVYQSEPTEVDMDYYLEPSAALRLSEKPVRITVGGSGFVPSRVAAAIGRPLTLRFVRTTDDTCAKRVLFPSLGLDRDLPLDREVDVALVPQRGAIPFSCGMGMFKGSVVGR